MSKQRLAYLVSRYPAISHTFILREVLGLRKLGIEIEVASINSPDRPTEKLTADETAEAARTFFVKAAGLGGALPAHLAALSRQPASYFRALGFSLGLGGADLRRIVYGLLYFVEAGMVGEWMREKGVTHLHVHFATPAATVGMIVTKMYPYTMSITVHGPDEFYDVPGYYLPQKIEASKLLCAISNYARSQLIRIVPASQWGKVVITRLGVDPDVFSPRDARPPNPVFEVLCVGRLVAAKGQQILLDAMVRLRAEGRSVCLRYVGDGPDRAALEARSKELGLGTSVIFDGAVNQDRIRGFYQSADVFALPSFAEGIPVVLMEAMAMEIPVVTTWITGVPELIRNGVDGLLVAPSDDKGLAAAIAQLMDSPELCASLGKQGRRKVVEEYNLGKSVEHLAGVFREHLS